MKNKRKKRRRKAEQTRNQREYKRQNIDEDEKTIYSTRRQSGGEEIKRGREGKQRENTKTGRRRTWKIESGKMRI